MAGGADDITAPGCSLVDTLAPGSIGWVAGRVEGAGRNEPSSGCEETETDMDEQMAFVSVTDLREFTKPPSNT